MQCTRMKRCFVYLHVCAVHAWGVGERGIVVEICGGVLVVVEVVC